MLLPISNIRNNSIAFQGLKRKETPCLFVFDLDGTLAMGNHSQITQILDISRKRNATTVYATGRNRNEFLELQQRLAKRRISLPNPDYLVSGNGKSVYLNLNGSLIEDTNYKTSGEMNHHTRLADKFIREMEEKVQIIPNKRYNDKISYFLSAREDVCDEIKVALISKIKANGGKIKFIADTNVRKDSTFICAQDKLDGILYLKKLLKIPYKEILIAGNAENDIGLAGLCEKGGKFICVNNSTEKLRLIAERLAENVNSIFFAKRNGACGILEGFRNL